MRIVVWRGIVAQNLSLSTLSKDILLGVKPLKKDGLTALV
jgi:hypothetical protein